MPEPKQHILMITGSRGMTNYEGFGGFAAHLSAHLARLQAESDRPLEITVIDGNAAHGADCFSMWYCAKHGLPRLTYPADWGDINALGAVVKRRPDGRFYNANAGFDRNSLMAEHCDSGLAFWDGESTGTEHAIDEIKKRGKPVRVVRYG